MEAVQELVDVISMAEFLKRESGNLGKLPPANLLEKPADLWNFFEVRVASKIVQQKRAIIVQHRLGFLRGDAINS